MFRTLKQKLNMVHLNLMKVVMGRAGIYVKYMYTIHYFQGIGRRLLERQGWQDGAGLGSSVKGISEALENDGQGPRDRTGFG